MYRVNNALLFNLRAQLNLHICFDFFVHFLNEYPLYCYLMDHKKKLLPYNCFDKAIWNFELFFLKGFFEAVLNKSFNVFMSFEAIWDHTVWQLAEHKPRKERTFLSLANLWDFEYIYLCQIQIILCMLWQLCQWASKLIVTLTIPLSFAVTILS